MIVRITKPNNRNEKNDRGKSSGNRSGNTMTQNGKMPIIGLPGSAPTKGKGRRYMTGLDGLRALAVLAVVVYHLNSSWAPGGLLGVCMFFVLSGYLITDLLITEWRNTGSINLKNFWVRRIKRLLPALFLMMASVLVVTALFAPERLSSLGKDVLAATLYSSNWWYIFHEVSYFESFGPPSPLGHLWSLAVEEQFYLLWPILLLPMFRFLPKRGHRFILTIVLALISACSMALIYEPGLDPSRVYYGTDTRAFALLIGAALAFIWPSQNLSGNLPDRKRFILDGIGGVSLLAILWMIWQTNQYDPFLYQGGLLLFSIITAILVAVLAHPSSGLGKLFSIKPLRWLGVFSYGIYLWHYPVIVLTSPSVNTGEFNINLAFGQVILSVLLAALSWIFVEEPIRHGKIPWPVLKQPRWWKRPLAISGKVTVLSVLMFFSASCLVLYGSTALISPAKQGYVLPAVPSQETPGIGDSGGKWDTSKKSDASNGGNTSKTDDTSPKSGQPGNDTGASSPWKNSGQSNTGDAPSSSHGTNTAGVPGKTSSNDEKREGDRIPSEGNISLNGKKVTVIGDSVIINVEPELRKFLPDLVVDAEVGRQMYQVPDLISKLKAQGKLGEIVILELGTNGSFTVKQLTNILDSLNEAEQILLMKVRVPKPWEEVVNEMYEEVAKSYPKVKVVDWYSASKGHNEYFYSDGVHLTPEGVQAYAKLVYDALN